MKKLIAFFEIPAADFRRAIDFYETVLNMKLPTCECEEEKMAFSLKGMNLSEQFLMLLISFLLKKGCSFISM